MKKIVGIIFLLGFTGASARNHRMLFENLSSKDGLSSPIVHCIARDTSGYLWIGTEDGLNRFDGYRFRTYRRDPGDPARSLSNSLIKCMLVDGSGQLWLGTGRGLNRYDPATDSFRVPRAVNDTARVLASSIVRALYEGSGGELFIGTQSGLYGYDPRTERLRQYPLPPGEHGNRNIVANICAAKGGSMWICTFDGLLRLDPATGETRTRPLRLRYPHDPENNLILCVSTDRRDDSVVWVGTETGLHRLDLKRDAYITYRMENGCRLSNNVIKCILPVGKDSLLLGTDRGLNLFDKTSGGVESFLHDASDALSFADNAVDQIYLDDYGICWFATRNGLSRISPYAGSVRVFDLPEGAERKGAAGETAQMFFTPTGAWYAFADKVLFVSERGDVSGFDSDYPIMDVEVIHVDSRGSVWVGSKNGLWYLDRRTERFRPVSALTDRLDSRFINDIAEDAAGDLWVTGTGCIYRLRIALDPRQRIARIEPEKVSLPNTSEGVSTLYADRTGAIWAGVGNDRIFRYDPRSGRFGKYDTEQSRGLVSLRVNLFLEDRAGTLHVVTDSGLYAYDPLTGMFANRIADERIECSGIRACRADEQNNLWILLETGLARLSPDGVVRQWNLAAFMPEALFVKDALRLDGEGTIKAGHSSGWMRIEVRHLPENRKASRPHITGVEALDTDSRWNTIPFDPAQPLRLRHDRNNVRISFSKLGNLFGNNLYAYRLAGVDQKWHTSYRSAASYINLPAGSYLFQVRDASCDRERGNDASLRIVVSPPWWATRTAWAAWLLIVLSAGFAVWRAVHRHIRHLHRKQAELREHYLRYLAVGAVVPPAEPAAETEGGGGSAPEASVQKQDPFLCRVIELIGSEIRNEDLDIRLLCDRLHMTHKSLYRKIKSLTGLNINELIRYVRLKEAARLLAETDKSVSEIAFDVGFAHRSYFSKCFVDHYELSPKEYREKSRK